MEEPTELPTLPSGPQLAEIPDLKVLLHQPARNVLDLDEYVSDPDTPLDQLRWSVTQDSRGPRLKWNSSRQLSVANPYKSGLYAATIHVSDGNATASQTIRIKVSRFIFDSFFHLPPQIVTGNQIRVTDFSLYDRIIPRDFPREQIRFEIPTPLPPGITRARILSNGKIAIQGNESLLSGPVCLPVIARYQSPTPPSIPSPTPAPPSPTLTPTSTPTPAATPTPAESAVVHPTPTPVPRLEITACGKQYVFTLEHIESTGPDPRDFALGDINRDGKPDFLTANFGNDTATLLLSQASQYEYQRTDLAAGGEGCLNVLIEDLDQDGMNELILLSAFHCRLRIIRGDMESGWKAADADLPFLVQLPLEYRHNARLHLLAAGRFFGNGEKSIAVAGSQEMAFYSFSQEGKIQFLHQYDLPFVPIQLLRVDLDTDGVDELAMSHTQPNGVTVFSFANGILQELSTWELDDSFHGNVPMAMVIDSDRPNAPPVLAVCTLSGRLDILSPAGSPSRFLGARVTNLVMTGMTGGDYDINASQEWLLAGLDILTEQPSLLLLCQEDDGFYAQSPPVPIVRIFPLQQSFSVSTFPLNGDTMPDLVLIDRSAHQLVFFINRTVLDQ